MDDHLHDFDSHLEDDLSYIYDLDGDYSRGAYRGGVDEEEGGETKALLLKIIHDNKKEYEEKLNQQEKRHVARIQQLEESIARLSEKQSHSCIGEIEASPCDMNIKRPEDTISPMIFMRRSHHTSYTTNMDSFQDDCREKDKKVDSQIESEDESEIKVKFAQDVFSIMMISPFRSKGYMLGIATFMFQFALTFDYIISFLVFALHGFSDNGGNHSFTIPDDVNWNVRLAQYCVALLSLWLLSDIQIAIQYLIIFRQAYSENMEILLRNQSEEMDKQSLSMFRSVYFPNILRLIQGFIVILMLLILIVENSDFIELLMNFTALFIISQIDDVVFTLVRRGYFFGYEMSHIAAKIEKIEFQDKQDQRFTSRGCNRSSHVLRSMILGMVHIGMIAFIWNVSSLQQSGIVFKKKYPYCALSGPQISTFGDGICNGGVSNTKECDFDGGDCIDFNIAYPDCDAPIPSWIGNNICDEAFSTVDCDFDGKDCCPFGNVENVLSLDTGNRLVNGVCDGGLYFTRQCEWDNYECDAIRRDEKYVKCDFERLGNLFDVTFSPVLQDGVCESSIYNILECGYEFGDCVACNALVFNSSLTGDGICHGGMHNSDECNQDARDCIQFNEKYPSCAVVAQEIMQKNNLMEHVPIIGDGICNSGLYNNEDCGYEDGDCTQCNASIENITKIGDGFCDGQNHMSRDCGYDGGDCAECKDENGEFIPQEEIGNGVCSTEYNTIGCSWDGGDCLQ